MTDFASKYKDWIGRVSGGDATQIAVDVGNGTPPDQSTVKYGSAELAFRRDLEAEHDEIRQQHPNSTLDVRE